MEKEAENSCASKAEGGGLTVHSCDSLAIKFQEFLKICRISGLCISGLDQWLASVIVTRWWLQKDSVSSVFL